MSQLAIRQMTRPEVDVLVSWAKAEGWNPGLNDAGIFWNNDPEAFIAAELNGKLVGGGTITSYAGEYGFMGFFIVRPEFRGRGLGNEIWYARRDRLIERLNPGATIGMDGVFNMQSYYAKGGFAFSHRNLRYRTEVALGMAPDDKRIVPLALVPFEDLLAYDRTCFPAPRETFLRQWIAQPHDQSLALGFQRNGELAGYGVVRKCGEGCKIGPLFANDAEAAEALYQRLSAFAAGGPLFLDAPENNPDAMALVERHGMEEVFGCARMYLGPAPDIRHERIYGVTTFELG